VTPTTTPTGGAERSRSTSAGTHKGSPSRHDEGFASLLVALLGDPRAPKRSEADPANGRHQVVSRAEGTRPSTKQPRGPTTTPPPPLDQVPPERSEREPARLRPTKPETRPAVAAGIVQARPARQPVQAEPVQARPATAGAAAAEPSAAEPSHHEHRADRNARTKPDDNAAPEATEDVRGLRPGASQRRPAPSAPLGTDTEGRDHGPLENEQRPNNTDAPEATPVRVIGQYRDQSVARSAPSGPHADAEARSQQPTPPTTRAAPTVHGVQTALTAATSTVPTSPAPPSEPPPTSPALASLDVGQTSAVLARLSALPSGTHVVALDLHPPGLGSVLARVQVSDTQLVVVLTPKDAAVAGALASNLADLSHQLGLGAGHRELTLRLLDPEAGHREQGNPGHQRHDSQRRSAASSADVGVLDAEPDQPETSPRTLDLRL